MPINPDLLVVDRNTPVKITDAQYIEDSKTMTAAQMAKKYGVGVKTVEKRLIRLSLSTQSELMVPGVSRKIVSSGLDAFDNLQKNMGMLDLLKDACHEYLLDAENPDKYDIGPRSNEVYVTYSVEIEKGSQLITEKRRKLLSELLDHCDGGYDPAGNQIVSIERAEYRFADPRELALKTIQEVRQTVQTALEAIKFLNDVRTMQTFRDTVVREIMKVDEETGRRIAEAVRRSISLQGTLGGLSSMASPGQPGHFQGP